MAGRILLLQLFRRLGLLQPGIRGANVRRCDTICDRFRRW